MILISLTGLSRQVIKELLVARVRTVEIRSPKNFLALLEVQPGDQIFLTESSPLDIVAGTNGLIALVKALEIITHRTVQSGEDYYEEREAQAARAQLQLLGLGRVRRIASNGQRSPLTLDVDEIKYCNAR